jgi:hypothetical protein
MSETSEPAEVCGECMASGRMGHASITVTADIYTDLYGDELDDVASALDALDDARGDLQ